MTTTNTEDKLRKVTRTLSDAQLFAINQLKDQGQLLLDAIDEFQMEAPIGEGSTNERARCFAIFRTKLEEAVMWATKGITA